MSNLRDFRKFLPAGSGDPYIDNVVALFDFEGPLPFVSKSPNTYFTAHATGSTSTPGYAWAVDCSQFSTTALSKLHNDSQAGNKSYGDFIAYRWGDERYLDYSAWTQEFWWKFNPTYQNSASTDSVNFVGTPVSNYSNANFTALFAHSNDTDWLRETNYIWSVKHQDMTYSGIMPVGIDSRNGNFCAGFDINAYNSGDTNSHMVSVSDNTTVSLTSTDWHHFAAEKQAGDYIRVYHNGTEITGLHRSDWSTFDRNQWHMSKVNNFSGSDYVPGPGAFMNYTIRDQINNVGQTFGTMLVDQYRLTVGVSRYNGNFTPEVFKI